MHRDVKPSNVIFVNGRPKLANIELVTDTGDTRSIVGTEGYLAPEGPSSPQADLFALGKVLYEALTGLDRRQLPQLPADLRAWPDARLVFELNEVILKACESDPRRRYTSTTALSKDLALLKRGQSVKSKRAIGRRLALAMWLLIVTAAIGFVGIAGYSFRFLKNPVASESSVPGHNRPENLEVIRLCKLGQFHHSKLTEEGIAKALECFSKAVEIDPNSVEAYTRIADLCVGGQGFNSFPLKLAQTKMRWVRDKLAAIDSGLAIVYVAEGYI